MCLFPIPNTQYDGLAYRSGVKEFDCGACPECLQKRSSSWALRAVYESKAHAFNCMVTLTYDNFKRDENGNILRDRLGNPIEEPVNPDLKVNKRDLQLFIKRLRKWYSNVSVERVKYIACAEYGKRTHRAHYHCILFGVRFPDIHFYKKSKRGNPIYMSNTLTKLWSHGICTVDSINVRSNIARYCTKYCAKQRSDETFMLFSQGLGVVQLLKDFNGRSYFVDGREYTIPRVVWQHYIMRKYAALQSAFPFSPKYVNKNYDLDTWFDPVYEKSRILRDNFRIVRNDDKVYQNYLLYWQHKAAQFDSIKLPSRSRILLLSEDKFHKYKVAALEVFDRRKEEYRFFFAPGSLRGKRLYFQGLENFYSSFGCRLRLLPFVSRHNTASDTSSFDEDLKLRVKYHKFLREAEYDYLISSNCLVEVPDFEFVPPFDKYCIFKNAQYTYQWY